MLISKIVQKNKLLKIQAFTSGDIYQQEIRLGRKLESVFARCESTMSFFITVFIKSASIVEPFPEADG